VTYVASVGGESFHIRMDEPEALVVNDEHHSASLESAGGPSLYSLIVDNSSYEVHVEEREGNYRVLLLGQVYDVHVEHEGTRRVARARREHRAAEGEDIIIRSPIPGLIFDVLAMKGQEVKKGDILVIVEAMKMENEIRAPRDATVKATFVAPGDAVDKGTPLVTLS
jgi:biotin carboxyl carrier protein